MDLAKKADRTALKTYFGRNAVPTANNFADLIEGAINQKEDGIAKLAGEPLSVQADGDAASQKKAINFYKSFADPKPAWTLSLNPRSDPANAATARPGWSVSDADGNSRLFIDQATGNIGVGTVNPGYRLNVQGAVQAINQNQDANGGALLLGPGNQANLRLGYHADYSWIQSHGGKPLAINPLGNSVGIGTASPSPGKTLDVNGDIQIAAGKMFSAPGRLHITGDELLYLLNKNGVIIGKEWGGNGNLQVQGTLTAKSVRVSRYAASVATAVALSTANAWGDFPQLSVQFTLAQEADVTVFYGITMPCAAAAGHLCTKLVLDNVEQPQTRSISGNVQYWSPSSVWIGTLAAGQHTFKVQYRTPHGGTLTPGEDWQKGSLMVTVYGAG